MENYNISSDVGNRTRSLLLSVYQLLVFLYFSIAWITFERLIIFFEAGETFSDRALVQVFLLSTVILWLLIFLCCFKPSRLLSMFLFMFALFILLMINVLIRIKYTHIDTTATGYFLNFLLLLFLNLICVWILRRNCGEFLSRIFSRKILNWLNSFFITLVIITGGCHLLRFSYWSPQETIFLGLGFIMGLSAMMKSNTQDRLGEFLLFLSGILLILTGYLALYYIPVTFKIIKWMYNING